MTHQITANQTPLIPLTKDKTNAATRDPAASKTT